MSDPSKKYNLMGAGWKDRQKPALAEQLEDAVWTETGVKCNITVGPDTVSVALDDPLDVRYWLLVKSCIKRRTNLEILRIWP